MKTDAKRYLRDASLILLGAAITWISVWIQSWQTARNSREDTAKVLQTSVSNIERNIALELAFTTNLLRGPGAPDLHLAGTTGIAMIPLFDVGADSTTLGAIGDPELIAMISQLPAF